MSIAGVVFNLFPALARAMRPACQTISSDTARFLEAAVAGGAPVRTGFLASSVYSITPKYGSTYATMGTPPGDSYALPPIEPDGPYESVVGVAANYGVYVNYGTRFMPAQPFFDEAVANAAFAFPKEAAKLEALLLEGI